MSDLIDIRPDTSNDWASLRLSDFHGDVSRIAEESSLLGGPFKLIANDPDILLQYLYALDEGSGWPVSTSFRYVHFEDQDGEWLWTLEHPTIQQVLHMLSGG